MSHDLSLDRRRFLARLAAGTAAAALPLALPAGVPGRRRRVLCFTKSSGWHHTVVRRGPDDAPSLVERRITDLARRGGFDVDCTKDGRVFTPAGLRAYDAFLFYTTGDLDTPGTDGQPPMPPGGKAALLDAVRGGKGFVGLHCASDTFHTKRAADGSGTADPYIAMLGGEFADHGKEQAAPVRTIDPRFPGMAGFVDGAPRMGEWYALRELAADLHVIQRLETGQMEGRMYERPPYPVTWTRMHGRGRVFYSALGHREDEWDDAAFLDLVHGAVRWACGDASGDTTPNVATVAPGYAELPRDGG